MEKHEHETQAEQVLSRWIKGDSNQQHTHTHPTPTNCQNLKILGRCQKNKQNIKNNKELIPQTALRWFGWPSSSASHHNHLCCHLSFISLFLLLLLNLHYLHIFLPPILSLTVIVVTCFLVFCLVLCLLASPSFCLHHSLWPASSANPPPQPNSGTNSTYHTPLEEKTQKIYYTSTTSFLKA